MTTEEKVGVALFNDMITRTAFEVAASLIDLRLLCDDPADYSKVSPIEPSDQGGRKIARTILRADSLEGHAQVICTVT